MNKVVRLKVGTVGHSRTKRVNSTISPSIRVSIGDVHLPFLTLVSVDEEYFFCTHEKNTLPEPRRLVGKVSGVQSRGGVQFKSIQPDKWYVILEAIKQHEVRSGYHINPHTFLVTWCLSKGVDLYGEGLLKL